MSPKDADGMVNSLGPVWFGSTLFAQACLKTLNHYSIYIATRQGKRPPPHTLVFDFCKKALSLYCKLLDWSHFPYYYKMFLRKYFTSFIHATNNLQKFIISSWEQHPINIQYPDWHTRRSTYTLCYVDRHTVCQLTYCMSIEIHDVYVDWQIDIQYVNQHIICQLRYCMSIGCCAQLIRNQETYCYISFFSLRPLVEPEISISLLKGIHECPQRL